MCVCSAVILKRYWIILTCFVILCTANVHVVAGDRDGDAKSSLQMAFPETKVISIGQFRYVVTLLEVGKVLPGFTMFHSK